jgi:hypothetical protein
VDSPPIKIAIVTGMHPFGVPPLMPLFRDLSNVDAYVQDLENFCLDLGHVHTQSDVVLFCSMLREPQEGCREALESPG